jgi:hypothetical protein
MKQNKGFIGQAFYRAGAETCPPLEDRTKGPFMDGHELILRFIVICGMFVDIAYTCQLFVGTNLIKVFFLNN